MSEAYRTGQAVYRLNDHLVWIPKYRRKGLQGAVAQRAAEIFREIAEQYELRIDTLSVREDHVQLFLSAPPRDAPAQIVNRMKRISAKKSFAAFPPVKKKRWAGQCWADGYSVGSSGANVTAAVIRRYSQYPQRVKDQPVRLF